MELNLINRESELNYALQTKQSVYVPKGTTPDIKETGMYLRPSVGNVFLLLLLIVTVTHPLCAKKPTPSPEKQIHMFMLAMDSGIIEKKALSELKRLTRSKDLTVKSRAIGLLAQYEGEGSGNLIKALTILTPYVLDKKEADAFKRKLIAAKGEKEFLQVIPPANRWKFKEPELCVSMARILAFGGKYPEALAAFDRVGRNREGVPRIIAAEGIGDIQFSLKRWEQCIGSYQFALKSIGYLKKLYKYEEMEGDPIIPALTTRIQRKLTEAKRKWEEELYGPGYVAYRNARQSESRNNCLSAIIAYKRITEKFPDTIYAEAAGLYGPKCNLDLNMPGQKENIRKTLSNLTEKIAADKKKLRKYGKLMTIPVRERLEKRIAADSAYLAELKQVPTGKKAEEKAFADLEKYTEAKPFGLYRGEAHLLKGLILLEGNLDLPNSNKHFAKALSWIKEARSFDDKLDRFLVKAAARKLITPPKTEYQQAQFGFVNLKTVKPEQLFNRKHCSWYLKWLKKQAILAAGFSYVAEKKDGTEFFAQLTALDEQAKTYESFGCPSVVSRLSASSKSGLIRCFENEMKGLKDERRLACLLGDYYYSCLIHDRSKKIYRNIINNKYGQPNPSEKAYAICGLGSCEFFLSNYKKAAEIFSVFEDQFKNTPIRAKGLFSWGQSNYAIFNQQVKKDQKLRREWEKAYKLTVKTGSDKYWGAYSQLNLAVPKALSSKYREEGREMLALVVKKYANARDPMISQFSELAETYIELSKSNKQFCPLE